MSKIAKFKLEIDTTLGKGVLFLYERWTRTKDKQEAFKPGDNAIGSVDFTIDKYKIEVSSLNVESNLQRKGYGRLIMRAIMALGEFYNLPVELDSLRAAEGFYQKLGMKNTKDTIYTWTPKKRKVR